MLCMSLHLDLNFFNEGGGLAPILVHAEADPLRPRLVWAELEFSADRFHEHKGRGGGFDRTFPVFLFSLDILGPAFFSLLLVVHAFHLRIIIVTPPHSDDKVAGVLAQPVHLFEGKLLHGRSGLLLRPPSSCPWVHVEGPVHAHLLLSLVLGVPVLLLVGARAPQLIFPVQESRHR